MKQSILNVEGMSCNHCVKAVTDALTALDGVSNVNVDLAGKKVTVEYEEETVSLDRMRDAIEDEGYDVI